MKYETIVGKRGAGKTYRAIERAIADSEKHETPRLYAFVGPHFSTAMFCLETHPWGNRIARIRKTSGVFELANGSRIMVFSEGDLDRARGRYFQGVVGDAIDAWEAPDEAISKLDLHFPHAELGIITVFGTENE